MRIPALALLTVTTIGCAPCDANDAAQGQDEADAGGPVGTCPHTPSIAGLPAGSPPGKSLAGSVAPIFPRCTGGFALSGNSVRGAGSSAPGVSDFFHGEAGVAYEFTVEPGAALATFVDNAKGIDLTSNALPSNTPNHEVIAASAGSLVNDGKLATYPTVANDAARNYVQTTPVVFFDNDAAHPVTVTNRGQIGVRLKGAFGVDDPLSGYGQENATGVFIAGAGSIVNEASGFIGGFNAIFTMGAGTIENRGTIQAINDGVLSGYKVVNREHAAINTAAQGFACIHAYGEVDNYGYMLGSDYGLLVDGKNNVINTYGGPLVEGVKNLDGSPVYDGMISALPRATNKPNDTGPYLAADAILLDGDGITVNLIARTIDGNLYLPRIVGPVVGGFNGTFNSKNDHKINTLNLQLDGVPKADADAFAAAIAASTKSNAQGTYYSGTHDLLGVHYHWEDFAHVNVTGTPK